MLVGTSGMDTERAGEREPAVRNISDTARWAAYFRAQETKRADALFRDPYAERLAGARGTEIANTLPEGNRHEWAWVARTYLFDQFIERLIGEETDLVVNLAAGLDARPYRMIPVVTCPSLRNPSGGAPLRTCPQVCTAGRCPSLRNPSGGAPQYSVTQIPGAARVHR